MSLLCEYNTPQAILALLFVFSSSHHSWGCSGCVILAGKGYRVGVEWGKVRDSCRGVLERWYGKKTMGEGRFGFGGKGVRYGYGCTGLKGMFGEEAKVALPLSSL
ncbi:hypothetical protein Tco_0176135, partial [Tanacetum coccineum]